LLTKVVSVIQSYLCLSVNENKDDGNEQGGEIGIKGSKVFLRVVIKCQAEIKRYSEIVCMRDCKVYVGK